MKDRIIRFVKALSNESVRRLPYIMFVLLVLLVIQSYNTSHETAQNTKVVRQNSDSNKVLIQRIATLSEDNKHLTQQNIDLQKQTRDQVSCITNLFIDFVNSDKSLSKADATNCSVSTQDNAQASSPTSQGGTGSSSASPSAGQTSPTSASSSSPQSNANGGSTPPNNSQPATAAPSPSIIQDVLSPVKKLLGGL